ncbi:MAG: HugZ family protein [Geminicoccaceae bacterium]
MTDDDRSRINLTARHLLRAAPAGSLATVMRESDGAPYASMVATATDHDGAPILLLSDLADHSKNLKSDDRISLLLTGSKAHEDPLAGERLSLIGSLTRSDAPGLRQRYLARHQRAAGYAEFADFGFYHMAVDRAHLIAGFGRIQWIEGKDLRIEPSEQLVAAEMDIVAHMNDDHADAVQLYATALLGRGDGDWRMTGVDGEGADLRFQEQVARLPFGSRVADSTGVRKELIRLVNKARDA